MQLPEANLACLWLSEDHESIKSTDRLLGSYGAHWVSMGIRPASKLPRLPNHDKHNFSSIT